MDSEFCFWSSSEDWIDVVTDVYGFQDLDLVFLRHGSFGFHGMDRIL